MKNLKQSLPATMAGIASKAGLKLAFGSPKTNGETIWVTDIPLNPTEDDYNLTLGDLGHEVGHILFTDFNQFASGLVQSLNNCFEDVRIEYLLEREFLGMADFLNKSYQVMIDKGYVQQPDTPANALAMYLISKYMIEINNRDYMQTDADKALSVLSQTLQQDVIDSIVSLCDSRMSYIASEASTTADSLQLAKDVVKLLEDSQESDEPEQPEKGGSGKSDEDSDDSEQSDSQEESKDDSGEGGDTDDSESDESDESDEESNSSNSSDSDGQSSGEENSSGSSNSQQENDSSDSESQSNGSSESESSDNSDDKASSGCSKNGSKDLLESDVNEKSPISLRDVVQAIAEKAASKDNSLKEFLGGNNIDNIAEELRQANGSGSNANFYDECFVPNLAKYNEIKANSSQEIALFRNKLVKYWTSRSRSRNVVNEHDGRFAASEAIRCMASGDQDFLVKRSKRTDKKPAICLLGDLSGSMDHEYGDETLLELQTKVMISLAETSQLGNVPLNILGFSGRVIPLKKWNDPMSKARGVVGGQKSIYGTQIVPAVYEGIRALTSRKEERKILIVMTDGQIGGDVNALRNLIAYTEKHHPDIEFYGLGMGVNLKSVFKKGGQVNSQNMSQTVLDILTQ
ncbi:hypothetical protein JCM30760_26950 [Thiomicrorhabdus hydrogeniphila]